MNIRPNYLNGERARLCWGGGGAVGVDAGDVVLVGAGVVAGEAFAGVGVGGGCGAVGVTFAVFWVVGYCGKHLWAFLFVDWVLWLLLLLLWVLELLLCLRVLVL